MWIPYNPNPRKKRVGDCVVRALTVARDCDWDRAFTTLCAHAYDIKDMPSADYVWGDLLLSRGFRAVSMPDMCPRCYTVREFCRDHPHGLFLLSSSSHVVAAQAGDYFDAWDSGDTVPTMIYTR